MDQKYILDTRIPFCKLISGFLAVALLISASLAPLPVIAATLVDGPNLALVANGGTVTVSSALGGYPASALNDGVRQTGYGYWNDATQRQYPDWAQVGWAEPRTIDKVVLRLPVASQLTEAQRTIGSLTLQYWDPSTGSWKNISALNGTPNPILQWVAPTTPNGSELREFVFDPVTTEKVRVVFDAGNSDGWSFLEEIEVYHRVEVGPAVTLAYGSGNTGLDAGLLPGDVVTLSARVTDAKGLGVPAYPVTFTVTAGGGEVLSADADPSMPGIQVLTGQDGEARAQVRTGPVPGENGLSASAPLQGSPVAFSVTTGSVEQAFKASVAWLREAAATLEVGSRRIAYDGTVMYTPDGVGSYNAFWVRDFEYMVEGYPEGIPLDDIRRGFEYLVNRQRADGAMPDRVAADGTGVYLVVGPEPPTDNSQFMVKLAYQYYRLTGDLSLFTQYKKELVRGMEFVPRSPATRLVYIAPDRPHSPYGFTDTVMKTGDLLFSSLLYFEAADNLAELFQAAGDDVNARRWEAEAAAIRRDLQTLYDSESGMFFAASVDNRQIDIWGSAYAVFIGAATPDQARGVAKYLKDHYAEVIRRGQVRHIAGGSFWQKALAAPGTYQNGAYWATPTGWVVYALSKVDPDLARRTIIDMVRDFRLNGVNEAFNNDNGYVGVRKYVASATLPLQGVRWMEGEAQERLAAAEAKGKALSHYLGEAGFESDVAAYLAARVEELLTHVRAAGTAAASGGGSNATLHTAHALHAADAIAGWLGKKVAKGQVPEGKIVAVTWRLDYIRRDLSRAATALTGGQVQMQINDRKVIPGQSFTVTLTFTNTGTRNVTGGSFSVAAPVGWTVSAVGLTEFGLLPPGDSASAEFQVVVDPKTATPAMEALIGTASARIADGIATLEDWAGLQVVPRLEVTLAAQRFTARSGGNLDLTAVVTNNGPQAGIAVRLEVPSGWPAPAMQSLTLGGDQSAVISFTITIPADAAGGYPLAVVATTARETYEARGEVMVTVPGANLALAKNGGAITVSSQLSGYPASAINDGVRNHGTAGYWNDATNNQFPDTVELSWALPQTLNRLLLRLPVMPTLAAGQRTIGAIQVEYWDGSTWRPLRFTGQSNPIRNWTAPTVADGTELKDLWFDPITTQKVRLVYLSGNSDGWSFLEELEAYNIELVNLSLPGSSGQASASSQLGGYPASAVNNAIADRSPAGYWNDATNGQFPDWVQVSWPTSREVNRVVLRLPVMLAIQPAPVRTIEQSTLQYWDVTVGQWVAIVRISHWTAPGGVDDGSQIKEFEFPTITTDKVRWVVEAGNADGWSFLDELETYLIPLP